jgi:hypothetical protein
MSYFVSYATADDTIDGEDIASGAGWAEFCEWASVLPEADYPELAYLGEHGECFTAEGADGDALATLADDLRRALRELPNSPGKSALGVARRLALVLKERPAGAIALVVTDGEEDEDEEEG